MLKQETWQMQAPNIGDRSQATGWLTLAHKYAAKEFNRQL